MTLLVAINLGGLAIIAADKKEVLIQDGEIYPLHESAEKIIDTGIGLITGSGYVSLLHDVKTEVSNETISNTDQILSIILRNREAIQRNLFLNENQKSQLLDKTGWLLSYRTIVDELPKLRVALFHPSISSTNFCIIEENYPKIIFPSDIDGNFIVRFSEELSNRIKKLDGDNVQNVVSHNVSVILDLVYRISEVSETVSTSCDIGLVFEDGENYMATAVSRNTTELNFVPARS